MLSYSSSRSSSKLPSSSQLLPTLLYLYLLTLTVALATSTSLPPTPGGESEANYHHYGGEMGIFLSIKGRSLAEGPSYSSGENGEGNNINGGYGGYGGESSLLILAPRRTHRKDPIDGFKYYNGGWNISERHYWASAGFSAAPLFIISLTWFLVFGLCLLIISLCHFCCRREQRFGYSRVAYILSLVLLILFTLAAVIGCLVLYTGQAKFHRSTISTLEYLKSQADTTVWKLNNVSDYLSSAKQIGVLGNYVCQVDPNGICFTTGRLTPAMYGQIATAVNVSYGLYNYGPDLVALEDCSFVRETFTSIYSDHCPGLRRYSRWVYAGLVMVSFAVMFSLIFWVIYGRERKHRLYTERRLSQSGHKKPSRMDYN